MPNIILIKLHSRVLGILIRITEINLFNSQQQV